jgi:FkbM family methyltransferase
LRQRVTGTAAGQRRLKALAQDTLRRFLVALAHRLAEPAPLRRVPGWWSGLATTPPLDAAKRLRLRLWRALAGTTIAFPWYDGLVLELVLGNDLSRCLFVGGEIDPNEFVFLAEVLQPGMTVLDIGANEGLYSIFCRQRVGAEGTVIAIEPSARECARIARNAALNHFHDIRIASLALADREGTARLRIAEDAHAGHNTLGSFAASWVRGEREESVPSTRLDTFLAGQAVGRVDLIKLDIEGAELAALRGAEATLRRHRPILLFEGMEEALQRQNASLSELLTFLRAAGYALFEFSPTTGAPQPLTSTTPQSVNLIAQSI